MYPETELLPLVKAFFDTCRGVARQFKRQRDEATRESELASLKEQMKEIMKMIQGLRKARSLDENMSTKETGQYGEASTKWSAYDMPSNYNTLYEDNREEAPIRNMQACPGRKKILHIVFRQRTLQHTSSILRHLLRTLCLTRIIPRWRRLASQVLPRLEEEQLSIFIDSLQNPYYELFTGNVANNFNALIKVGEYY
ncbi:hypothetical protein Lal_00001113 [Lupinus albus]|nr:hypothetical protein Lal_00001113 [Lupinus albus]